MRPPFDLGLYLVTDRRLCAARGLEATVAEAVAGGVTLVQLRDDDTPLPELVGLARALRAVLAGSGVPLIVNNHVDVAVAAAAEGLHVGQGDLAPARARQALGPGPILGLSITDPLQLATVDQAVVDYLGVGPIFATATKADAAEPMGLAGLAVCRARTGLPIVAIGGIDAGNAASVLAAGADGAAVVSAVCGTPDPRVAAGILARAVARGKREREAR